MRSGRLASRVDRVTTHDVAVVGSGVAGLTVALETSGLDVAVLTPARLGETGSSPMAQGGVAAAVGPGDSPASHAADTLAAADGHANPARVRTLTEEGPARVAALLAIGARFDLDRRGGLALGREAAHSHPRILHANGDATGAEIVRARGAEVRAAGHVRCHEQTTAQEIVVQQGRAVGVFALDGQGARVLHLARAVVLATGGIGQLYRHTTNLPGNVGDGLAMAARIGARLEDLEFVQFHPTALAVGADPMPLLTEALRGAGATLIDERGYPLMRGQHPAGDLASRDVVARALWQRLADGGGVRLDARPIVDRDLEKAFPTAVRHCRAHGFDLTRDPVPVTPAAHYHMGGIAVDGDGRTTVPGLWACGEVSAVGVHGANRLASNSLLDGLVFGARVGRDLVRTTSEVPPIKVDVVSRRADPLTSLSSDEALTIRTEVRDIMWERVGLVRDADGLHEARAALADVAVRLPDGLSPSRRFVDVARLVTEAALARPESRGAHFRRDDWAAGSVREAGRR